MYVYKAAVIGAGAMGAEIAQVITYSGIPVLLKDVDQGKVDKGISSIRKIYDRRVAKGKLTQDELEKKMTLVTGVTSNEGFSDVDIVIEAVPENLDLKKKIFKEMDEVLPESAIIASNTSSLSISSFGEATKRPNKVIGMHFFYPAHVMKLVEVISGKETAADVIDDVVGFAESLRKLPVRVNECPGFLVNRILMPYLNEAAYCVQEGAASFKEIDNAVLKLGFPMGPFTLVDNLGFDVCLEVVRVLLDGYGSRMQPADLWNAVESLGRLGMKSGSGFYLYGEKAGSPDTELENVLKTLQGKHKKTEFSINRVILPLINESIRCLEEDICTAADIDLAVVAGLGFPQEKGGILHYADEMGLDNILKELEGLAKIHGERFNPAPLLKKKVSEGHLGKATKEGFFSYTS